MSHAEPIGGIVGAATRTAHKAYGIINNPDAWALRLVFFAGIITVIKKNYVPEEPWSYAMWFGITLGIAALLYEMSASKGLVRAWYRGRFGAMVTSAVMWAVAIGFSVNNWVGAAAENQAEKTNVHKAAYLQTQDTRKAVTDLEKELARLQAKHDWSKSVDAPDSYDARIEAAEADAAYEATRRGCKSKCIAKQQLAASLKAERAIAIDRATTAEEIKVIQTKLDEARTIAASTKVETSEARNDLVILTRYAGMSEEGAQLFNGLFSILAISVFISLASMRAELDKLRAEGPRQRSNLGIKLKVWFARTFLGRDPKHTTMKEEVHNHVTVSDERAVKALKEIAAEMRLPQKLAAA